MSVGEAVGRDDLEGLLGEEEFGVVELEGDFERVLDYFGALDQEVGQALVLVVFGNVEDFLVALGVIGGDQGGEGLIDFGLSFGLVLSVHLEQQLLHLNLAFDDF